MTGRPEHRCAYLASILNVLCGSWQTNLPMSWTSFSEKGQNCRGKLGNSMQRIQQTQSYTLMTEANHLVAVCWIHGLPIVWYPDFDHILRLDSEPLLCHITLVQTCWIFWHHNPPLNVESLLPW